VLDSERTVRRICSFLGEEFEPNMLAWPKNLDDFIPERGKETMHRNLKRMPEKGDAFRWKSSMSPREEFVCEAFMSDRLRSYGYELKYRGRFWTGIFPIVRLYCLHLLPVLSLPMRAVRRMKRLLLGSQIPAKSLHAESQDAA